MKFRKKPLVVDAFRYKGKYQSLPKWMLEQEADWTAKNTPEDGVVLLINTLEGQMTVNVGDWIIRGIKGKLHTCKDEIFRETYEEEGQDTASPTDERVAELVKAAYYEGCRIELGIETTERFLSAWHRSKAKAALEKGGE